MVKDHSDSEKGNPLPPYRLLFPISSKGSFISTDRIAHTTAFVTPVVEHWLEREIHYIQALTFITCAFIGRLLGVPAAANGDDVHDDHEDRAGIQAFLENDVQHNATGEGVPSVPSRGEH